MTKIREWKRTNRDTGVSVYVSYEHGAQEFVAMGGTRDTLEGLLRFETDYYIYERSDADA